MSTVPTPVVIFDLGGVLIDWDPRDLYGRLFRDDNEAMEYFRRRGRLAGGGVRILTLFTARVCSYHGTRGTRDRERHETIV